MPKTFFVICPNQIAMAIAIGLSQHIEIGGRVIAIYWPNRCSAPCASRRNLKLYPYSKLTCIFLWFVYRLQGAIEILVPHKRLGDFINLFARCCDCVSLVDDGLDTLRNQAKNIVAGSFPKGTRLYTFNYPMRLGKWLENFEIRHVADLEAISQVSRPLIDLTNVAQLIVESPPLNRVATQLGLEQEKTLLVTHSNPNKRSFQPSNLPTIQGASYAIESSLDGFMGEVIVGESMVAVFALWRNDATYKVTVWLDSQSADNLEPLVQLIRQRSYGVLRLI